MSSIIIPRHEVKDKISTSVTSSWNSHNRYGLLWVYGPAGVGKTTIIRSVAESLLQKPKDPPTYVLAQPVNPLPQISGACLFLSRENPVADSRQLFADLAHDLARRYPKIAPFIQHAFDITPGIQDLSLEQQCDSLLVDPIRTWAQDITEDHQIVVFVDGLDACDGGKSEHLKIIDVIHQSFQSLMVDHVKWQWIISSRSEPWIYSTFNELTSDPRVQIISVPLASQQETGDYISRSLQGIAGRSGRLDSIRWHSAGYFAYAASLIAYVDLPTAGRSARFRNVVTHAEHESFKHEHTHMFTQLDEMYTDILVRVPLHLRDLTKRVLGAISVTQPSSSGESNPTALMLSKLLGISVEEIHDVLYHLHSVITAGQDFAIPGLTFYHKSFNDFLRNPSRSRDWCIDLLAVHADLAKCCLKKLSVNADENSPAYQYATKLWFVHCWRAGANPDAPNSMDLELDILSELNKFDYTLLPRDQLVDRYFVEWLLWLQVGAHPLVSPETSVLIFASRILQCRNTQCSIQVQDTALELLTVRTTTPAITNGQQHAPDNCPQRQRMSWASNLPTKFFSSQFWS